MTQLEEDIGELACLATIKGMEFALICAVLDRGFNNTAKHVLNFQEAMGSPNKDKWMCAMEEEHNWMVKHNIWKAVPPSAMPKGEKIITSTWANKKKSNGTYRA